MTNTATAANMARTGSATKWASGEVVANGIRQHYWRTGGGERGQTGRLVLVLAHGATDNGLCWTRLARALESDYDVVMPDARGHGRTEAPEGDYSAGARAADLAGLIKELGLERPVVGGHSMGAGTALRLVAEYPDLARAAILEDPGLRDAPPGTAASQEAAARRERMRQNAAEMKALGKEGLVARARERNPHWGEDEYDAWAESKLQVSERFSNASRGPERPDWRELLPRVTCPVLLITADPQRGGIVTPEIAAEAQRLLPSIKTVRIDGAGHSVRRDKFDEYVVVVREFLAGV